MKSNQLVELTNLHLAPPQLSAPKMQLLCAQVAYMASKMSGFLSRSTGSADYHKEAEGQAYGAVEQGRGAESEFDHKQLDLLMKLSMKHKVSTQAEVRGPRPRRNPNAPRLNADKSPGPLS